MLARSRFLQNDGMTSSSRQIRVAGSHIWRWPGRAAHGSAGAKATGARQARVIPAHGAAAAGGFPGSGGTRAAATAAIPAPFFTWSR